MAGLGLDAVRKNKLKIYAFAALLVVCLLVLSACSADRGTYNISEGEQELSHFIARMMFSLNNSIGKFGWTVIVFTIILKVALSPLDIWQKHIARKNKKAMERMKPQLAVLAEKCGDDKSRYQKEQMALYKKEKYSMMGACLPTIVTLVVFIVIFAGFREMVGFQYAQDYMNSRDKFQEVMYEELDDLLVAQGKSDYVFLDQSTNVVTAQRVNEATVKAQKAVADDYLAKKDNRDFYWINNIFIPDAWQKAVPTYVMITGQEGLSTSKVVGMTQDEYNLVMKEVLESDEYGYGKNGSWNGLLILPVLSLVMAFFSQKILTKSQGTPPPTPGKSGDSMQANMKAMQFMMPLMMGFFSLMYSSAFALYMFTSSVISILFQMIFSGVGKLLDVRAEKKMGYR